MKKTSYKKLIRDWVFILLGSAIYAAGVAFLLDPNNLAPGGVSGIAIVLNRLIHLPTGVIILCLNIPIMIVGTWKLGFRVLYTTIFATVFSSAIIDLIAPFGALTHDPLLAAVIGGTCSGFGIALVFKAGATTGGTDVLARLIKLKYPYMKLGKMMLFLDGTVVVAAALVFRNIDKALYAGISLVIFSLIFDAVLYGPDSAKLVYVISDRHQQIVQELLKLDIGVTYLRGIGAYTNHDKCVILCAMRKQLFPQMQEIVRESDPDAFLIVTSANEIFGEGFKSHYNQQF